MIKSEQAQSYRDGENRDSNSDFLFPLGLPVQVCVSPLDPLLIRLLSGAVGRVGGQIPPILKDPGHEKLSNLYVGLHIGSIENEIVSGGGVTAECWVEWESHGADATDEAGGPFMWPLPSPGQVFDGFGPHGVIYKGLIDDGCGSTSTFRIEHRCRVGEWSIGQALNSFVEIGTFHGVDNSTIQPTGYWTFHYTVRAHGTNGGVSDFKFKGTVPAICTGLESV